MPCSTSGFCGDGRACPPRPVCRNLADVEGSLGPSEVPSEPCGRGGSSSLDPQDLSVLGLPEWPRANLP